jgi:hypothetical protein
VSPSDSIKRLLEQLAHPADDVGSRPSSAAWIGQELRYVWHEAKAEASQAYSDWQAAGGADVYAAYRAAQDRADAAQDALANWAAAGSPDTERSLPWNS